MAPNNVGLWYINILLSCETAALGWVCFCHCILYFYVVLFLNGASTKMKAHLTLVFFMTATPSSTDADFHFLLLLLFFKAVHLNRFFYIFCCIFKKRKKRFFCTSCLYLENLDRKWTERRAEHANPRWLHGRLIASIYGAPAPCGIILYWIYKAGHPKYINMQTPLKTNGCRFA